MFKYDDTKRAEIITELHNRIDELDKIMNVSSSDKIVDKIQERLNTLEKQLNQILDLKRE